jgi:hypothetical protein
METFRVVEFRYKRTKDELIICDIPSTITVSYNTVNDILDLGVGESYDKAAEERFLTQERDSFYFCLNKLTTEKAIASKLKRFRSYLDNTGKENTEKVQNMQMILKNQVNIETIDLNRG